MPWSTSDRRHRLPPDWDTIRRRILHRDHHTCTACGGTRCGNRNLQVDHIAPGDDHRDTNLTTLGDDPCHRQKSAAEGNDAQAARRAQRRRPAEPHPGARPAGRGGGG